MERLQATHTEGQTSQQCVQERDNAQKRNIQRQLHRHDQTRQRTRQRSREDSQQAKTQDGNCTSNGSEHLNDDERQSRSDGDKDDLALLLGVCDLDIGGALSWSCGGARQLVDLAGG